MGLINALPAEHRVAFDIAELQHESSRNYIVMWGLILEEIKGLPEGLKMGCGSAGIVKRAHLFEPFAPSSSPAGRITPEMAMHTPAMKFLLRKAARHQADKTPWNWSSGDEYEYENSHSVTVDVVDASHDVSDVFVNGAIVKFVECVRLHDYNGMRGRLYALLDNGRWQVRMLGKDQGHFVTVHPMNIRIDESQRQFVSSVDVL